MFLAIALSACHHRATPSTAVSSKSAETNSATTSSTGSDDPIGKEVLAVVEKMELKAHTEHLSDGSVIVSNIVSFGIVEPRRLDTLLTVHTPGLPRIGTRRVQLGDVVYFVLPRNWRVRDLEMSDLQQLRFRD